MLDSLVSFSLTYTVLVYDQYEPEIQPSRKKNGDYI